MAASRALALALCGALTAVAGPGLAAPAELPPPGFAGAQYVDSTGCVFGRGAAGGWQPRLTRDGRPLCGYVPSGGVAAGPFSRPETAPVTIVEARTVPGGLTNCPNRPVTAQRYRLSDGRAVMRCSTHLEDPAGFINGAGVPGLVVAGGAPTAAMLLLDIALRTPLQPAAAETRAPARAKAPAQSGERFVQIGAFGDPDNAQRVKAQLRALGLPVATSQAQRGGRALELIFSGPFDAKGAEAARRLLRRNGFPEAFVR